ncbi:hypothetical protein I5M32_11625 [Pedobacter sp. SD-b]|uniref:Glycosyl hydrolase family 30 beta sandwich domain-containing protein n=1 Tax=Pedobacter segetis TaxID=2793069 RepID=A0ABS1BLF2_9SPHI|nr:glycoside hydrolase family 30 beta sandwich domain-containing protein [Pedobacter segetis]MBK0383607.1 hypothetical protein [Pedobacter segetis]
MMYQNNKTTMRSLRIQITLAFFFFLCHTVLANPADSLKISLPKWKEPANVTTTKMTLGYGKTIRAGWGRYSLNERQYFSKVLPSLFKKTLVLDSINGDRGIKWIFTGPRAGFYLILKDNTFKFYHQYYDSFGFNEGLQKALVYPRSIADTIKFSTYSPIKAITVEINYKLELIVSLNGQELIKEKYIDDVRRNQIQLTGNNGTLDYRILEPEVKEEQVSVNPDKTYQQILGWGGTSTPTAYNELSEAGKAKWWDYIKEYNLLCQREYPTGGALNYNLDNFDNPNDAKAHYYGDNFPNGETSNFQYNKKIQDLGGFVIFEFWDFPKWMDGKPEEYTRAIVGYCQQALKKTGKAPRIVGVQNELNMPEETVKKFVPALRIALDKAGFENVKIHMANAGHVIDALERASSYTQNPEVWNAIDYTASNEYDYQNFYSNPDGFDTTLVRWDKTMGSKPFLAVEICTNDVRFQTDSYRIALTIGQLYQKNLTLANAVLMGYCWNILNIEQPNFGATRSLFISSPENGFMPEPSSNQLRVFGAYSRRIKEGMQRVEVKTNNKDLKVVAFKGKGKAATMVVLNRSLNPINLKINWANVDFDTIETVDPYSPNLASSFKGKEVTVEPGAFVTLTNVPLNK